jgi:L,D-peptidoglycan transpeptidase YkuD (ErfK/YbiS/YcfS/YnhG family)
MVFRWAMHAHMARRGGLRKAGAPCGRRRRVDFEVVDVGDSRGRVRIGDGWVACALGRGGVIAAGDKREGDGATPLGAWPLRRVLFRPDRGAAPQTALAFAAIAPDDGWCDAPEDGAYNRPVTRPYPRSCERMWRDDGLYDLVVVLGHNDEPPIAGAGSAVFLHLAKPDYAPTEGCVALARPDLEALLSLARPGDALRISPAR